MNKKLFFAILLSCTTITQPAAGMRPLLPLSRNDIALAVFAEMHKVVSKEIKPLVPTSLRLSYKTTLAFYKFLRWTYRSHEKHPAYARHLFPGEEEEDARE